MKWESHTPLSKCTAFSLFSRQDNNSFPHWDSHCNPQRSTKTSSKCFTYARVLSKSWRQWCRRRDILRENLSHGSYSSQNSKVTPMAATFSWPSWVGAVNTMGYSHKHVKCLGQLEVFTAYKPDLQSVRGRLCALPEERPYEEGDEHGAVFRRWGWPLAEASKKLHHPGIRNLIFPVTWMNLGDFSTQPSENILSLDNTYSSHVILWAGHSITRWWAMCYLKLLNLW